MSLVESYPSWFEDDVERLFGHNLFAQQIDAWWLASLRIRDAYDDAVASWWDRRGLEASETLDLYRVLCQGKQPVDLLKECITYLQKAAKYLAADVDELMELNQSLANEVLGIGAVAHSRVRKQQRKNPK